MAISSWVIGGECSKATVYKRKARVRGHLTGLVAWGCEGALSGPAPCVGGPEGDLVTTAGCWGVEVQQGSSITERPSSPRGLRLHTAGLRAGSGGRGGGPGADRRGDSGIGGQWPSR